MTSLRVYLCARFGRQAEMREVARWLEGLGYVVTSRWLDAESDDLSPVEEGGWALKCERDIDNAHVVIAFSDKKGVPGADRGGRHDEFGYARGCGKEIILVGEPEHIFHRHPSVLRVTCKADMVPYLQSLSYRHSHSQATT